MFIGGLVIIVIALLSAVLYFEKKSNLLGTVKTTVTQINSGNQHNVVPSELVLVLSLIHISEPTRPY